VLCSARLVGHVELKRADESITVLRIVWRMLPRNGGRALFLLCPSCDTPRRHVYGWEWDSFSGWSNRVRSISCGAGRALGFVTLPKVVTCIRAPCFGLSETCRGRSRGFLTRSPRLKRLWKLASVNCRPSVATGSADTVGAAAENLRPNQVIHKSS
jgi:hypothetical protein